MITKPKHHASGPDADTKDENRGKLLYAIALLFSAVFIIILVMWLVMFPVMKRQITKSIMTEEIVVDGGITSTTVDVEHQYAAAGLDEKVSESVVRYFTNTEAGDYLTKESIQEIADIVLDSFEESGIAVEDADEMRDTVISELEKIVEEKNLTSEEYIEALKNDLQAQIDADVEFSETEREKLTGLIDSVNSENVTSMESLKTELMKEVQGSKSLSSGEIANIKSQLSKLENGSQAGLDGFKEYVDEEVVPEINTVIAENSQKIDDNSTGIAQNATNIANIASDVNTVKDDVDTVKDDVDAVKDDVDAVKGDVEAIQDSLDGCKIEYDANDRHFYIVYPGTGGADSVRKKLDFAP